MSGSRRKPGALGSFVEGYRDWLLERGYTRSGVVVSLVTLGHLGRWMEREAIAVEAPTAATVSDFLSSYCEERGRPPDASVTPLLEYLRFAGVAGVEPVVPATPLDRFVSDYRDWLTDKRGLAPVTVRSSESFAHRFLVGRASVSDPSGVLGITAMEINDFLVGEAARVSLRTAGNSSYRLRSLLRYLTVRGLADHGLADAVPRIARWRQATIPQFPTRPEIERLLDSCDRRTRAGARDYAVLILLARLGLRSIEVSRLELEDLDWRAGEITVDGKAHERARLPLPTDVGQALVEHLTRRGQHAGERRVFLTVRAPIGPLAPNGVGTIVHTACRRAGVELVAAHRLRHALASELLREGASMVAIGQVLRHRHLESTAIYAKVDLDRLRLAAHPWPGSAR